MICCRCSCSETYFVSELLYCNPERLTNQQKAVLIVITFTNTEETVNKLSELLSSRSVILDIDLDYFSTTNPFLELYSSEQLRLLAELYFFKEQTTPEKSAAERSQQLKHLYETMKNIHSGNRGDVRKNMRIVETERYKLMSDFTT